MKNFRSMFLSMLAMLGATTPSVTWPRAFSFTVDTAVASFTAWAVDHIKAMLIGYAGNRGFVIGLDQLPSGADFNARRVTNPGQSEIYRQRFYDALLYPTAGQAQFTFFSQPVGQGVTSAQGAVVGTGKTLWDTNLELPNTLPSGKQFLIESIELIYLPGSSAAANTYTPANPSVFAAASAAANFAQANDLNTFYQSGLLSLNVLSKNYLREFTQAFPPKASLDVSAGLASTSATAGQTVVGYAKAVGRPYYLSPEITLQPAVNFELTLTYPAAVATPSGFNARIIAILDGYWMRASQ